jgi:putative endonuclease
MAKFRQSLGQRGEELAEVYLRQRGYKILRRNYRFGKGELDLICQFDDDLVIVEVKSIRSSDWGSGEERISRRKQSMIIRTTYAFLAQNKQLNGLGVRFDVVVINFKSFPAQITHYCGAFWQGMS